MSYANPFGLSTPLPTSFGPTGTTQWSAGSQQHGFAERNLGGVNYGGYIGITPPHSPSPRSARGTRGRTSSRSREQRNSPRHSDEDDAPQQGWGPRIVALEQKVLDLQGQLQHADSNISKKLSELQTEAGGLNGRVEGLERTLPQRIQMVENRQALFVETINSMTVDINMKIKQVEQLILAQPGSAAPPTTGHGPCPTTVPPVPPSFGGPQAQHFHMGSPLSAPPGIGATQCGSTAPTPDPWHQYSQTQAAAGINASTYVAAPPAAPAASVTTKYWDERQWSITHAKVSKELKPFNGSDAGYRTWAGRVKDHFKEVNKYWALVFAEIERQQSVIPMSSQTLAFLQAPSGEHVQVDFAWVTNVLWTFIGRNIIDTMYGNRSAVASGPDNGIELWRAYYVKHEGGADQVELGGIDSLHTFPQCQKVEDLGFWVGKWIEMKDTYGHGMSDIHLRSRFLNILPESVKKDVRETKGMNTLQDMILHVQKDLGRLNDSKIAKLHSERLKQSLSQTHRVHAINTEDVEQPTGAQKSEDDIGQFQDMINALSSKIDTIAAAVDTKRAQPRSGPHAQRGQRGPGQRGPSDFAKFKGCLHCGGNHLVKDCRNKKKLLEENNGKLPAGFKSAFDKWKEKQPKKVAALTDAELQDDDLMSESDFAWGVCCNVVTEKPCDFSHPNSFEELFNEDSYEDEEDGDEHMLKALQQFASKVSTGPKVSQKQKKSLRPKPIDRRTVAAIAKQVRNGNYNLPDLQLESDERYEAKWALVDTGAGRSCAKRSQHFGSTKSKLNPSTVKMATASGEELKSRGCFTLNLLTAEGNSIQQTFEDADVDIPIMSVTELASNGPIGSDVIFRQNDGAIVDLQSGAVSKFLRRKGVYFIKVFTLKNRQSSFTRLGAA